MTMAEPAIRPRSRQAGRAPSAAVGLPSGVVTFLLTDIERSTELWDRHLAAMTSALARHDELVAQVVARRRGCLVKSQGEGDSTLSVFQRASDAVAAAVELRQALENEPWPGTLELRVRMAVHTGEAHERDGDYFGPAVNRAARVRALANGGQILLSTVTAELVRERLPEGVTLVDSGERALRGLARAERIFEVAPEGTVQASAPPGLAPPAIPPMPDALTSMIAGPFVGRDPELGRLAALLEETVSGGLRCAFVAGEPGIGKTRLSAEFADREHGRGAVVLYGRVDEEPVCPYQPFVEALRRWAGVLTPDQRVSVPRAEHLSRLVAEFAGAATPAARDDPEVERYRFFEAVASALAHASLAGPLLLVIDDLHWADRSTLQLLRHLLHGRSAAAILVLGTYRESELARSRPLAETLADLRRERAFERIVLRGLHEAEIVDLLQQTAEHDVGRRGRALAHALSETTEGNPFFIEQIIGNLIESGRLIRSEGQWSLDTKVDQLGIPEGIIEAIGRRLSRLSESCNRTLAAASVLGRDFEVDLLMRMVDLDPDDVVAAVEEALRAGLVREILQPGHLPACTFSHALVQQTLYEELSLSRKQRLHLRAVAAVETAYAADLEPYITALARHLRAAGTAAAPEKTIDYSVRAMEAARRVFAFEDAMAYGDAALELAEDHGTEPATQARILERLGDLAHVAGVDYQRSIAGLEQALRMYEGLGDDAACARVHSKLGRAFVTYWGALDIPRAQRHLRAAQGLFGPSPDPMIEARLAITIACAALYAGDIAEAGPTAQRVREIGDRFGDAAISSIGLQIEAWSAMWSGRIDDGLALAEQAWQIADRIDHLAAAFVATWLVGPTAQMYVDANESLRFLQRELAKPRLAQATNMRLMLLMTAVEALAISGDIEGATRLMEGVQPESHPEIFTGWSHQLPLVIGDWQGALRLTELSVARQRLSGSPPMLAYVLEWQGHVLFTTGALDEARRALEEAASLAFPYRKPAVYGRLAVLEAGCGRLDQARVYAARSDDASRDGNGWRGMLGFIARGHGALAAAEGRFDDAGAALRDAAQTFAQYGFPWEEADTLHLWGRALSDAGDLASADEKFDAALAIYRRPGAGEIWVQRILADRRRAE